MENDEPWLHELRNKLTSLSKTTDVKPLMDSINELSYEHQVDAKLIINEICAAIASEVKADKRLAYFYLFDSLSKNRRIKSMFRPLIADVIELPFVKSYQHMNSSTKALMDKTLRAWKSNDIFQSTLLDSIRAQCDNPALIKSNTSAKQSVKSSTSSKSNGVADPRRRPPPATNDHHDAKRLKRDVSPASQPNTLSPEIEQTLLTLSSSLQPYPHLMPMLHRIRTALSVSNGDMEVVGPQIKALTLALGEAVRSDQHTQPPQPVYAPLPPQQSIHQQPVPQLPINYTPSMMYQPNYPQQTYGYHPPPPQPMQFSHQYTGYPNHLVQPALAPPPHAFSESLQRSPVPKRSKTLDVDDLKIHDPSVVNALYDEAGDQCQTCGFRCKTAVAMSAHLDYHFKLNRREAKRDKLRQSHALHRDWYWTAEEWTTADDVIFGKLSLTRGDEESDSDGEDSETDDLQAHSVLADDSQTQCPVCLQSFETFWNEEEEAWMYRGSITVNDEITQLRLFDNPDDAGAADRRVTLVDTFKGQILHVNCALSLVTNDKLSTTPPTVEESLIKSEQVET